MTEKVALMTQDDQYPDGTDPADPETAVDPDQAAADDRQGRGCLIAAVGMTLLILTPALGSWVAIPKPLGVGLFVVAVLALVAGAAVGVSGALREPSPPRRADREPL